MSKRIVSGIRSGGTLNPTFDDSGWEQLDGSKSWGAQTHPNTTGFVWYRRSLDVSTAPGTLADLALLVPRIDDVYEIYWNGRLVAHHGRMPPHPSWFLGVPAQTFGLGPIGRGVLAVGCGRRSLARAIPDSPEVSPRL